MRFSTYLNNAKCMEWQINATQGILFSLLYEAPAWAKEEIIENKTYYFVSRNLILDELPMFFEKSDTVYRNLKALQEKGLIEYIKQGKRDLIRITAKGKTWNEFKENNSEKNPSFEENSEKNPSKFRKKSEKQENNSEKNPTNNNTIYNNTNILNNNIHVKNEFSQSCEKIKNQWIKIAYEFDLSGKQLKINDKRKRAINNLLKEYSLKEMLRAMGKIRTSNFLQGNNKTGWQISFDWFTNKSNFLKVLEGNYDDKENISNSKKEKKSSNYQEQEKDFVGVTNESIANLLGGLTGNE